MLSTPILNPPQTGILGMHNIVERPVVKDGNITIRPIMYLALSYDHRIIDGKEAVSFLKTIKGLSRRTTKIIFRSLIMENNFDVIVIGSGPGGYVCAIRSSSIRFKNSMCRIS